jgi:hypothetical protein
LAVALVVVVVGQHHRHTVLAAQALEVLIMSNLDFYLLELLL